RVPIRQLAGEAHDRFHFHGGPPWQSGDPNDSPGRIGLAEILDHDLIDASKVTQIREIDSKLGDAGKIATRPLTDGAKIIEDTAGLHGYVAHSHQIHGYGIQGNLARQVN